MTRPTKIWSVFATVALAGAIGLGDYVLDQNQTATKKGVGDNWRQAVASWPCLQSYGITPETLRDVCIWGKLYNTPPLNHIVCLTDRQQVHPCEVDPPDEILSRFGVCRYQVSGQWVSWTGFKPVDWTPPAEWTCVVVLPSGFWEQSMGNYIDPLVLALRDKCGWENIYPTDWGNCPVCLIWPEGCPPCRLIADKYGRDWVGHEGECP